MDITEDQTSADQLREAFRGIASDKVRPYSVSMIHSDCLRHPQPFVTELDLRVAQLPASAIDYLREVMPIAEN